MRDHAAIPDSPMWRRWREIEPHFDAAIELPMEERAAYLRNAIGHDAELLAATEELLRRVERTAGYLGLPAVDAYAEFAADLVESEASIGERIGAYRIVGTAGRGGMGIVFVAERADDQYQSRVALKVLKQGMDDPVYVRRFQDERQILASLVHPHIARLYDGGVTGDGRPWFAMEYVDGAPIDEFCDARRMPIKDRLKLFLDVCDAVQFAHQAQVIHRDVKPSNILVQADGDVKLLDFGIAKALANEERSADTTRTGYRMLTPQYASPEQIRGEAVTHASDVYSLGVVLFKLLTGSQPYGPKDPASHRIERAILEDEAERPSAIIERADESLIAPRGNSRRALRRQLVGDLDAITAMALRKEPERRYATVEALATDIRWHLDGFPVVAHRGAWAYRATKFVKRRRAQMVGSFAALALTFAAVGTQRWATRRAAKPPVEMRQVTFRGDVVDAAVARDGRWLAYVVRTDSGQEVLAEDLANKTVTKLAGGSQSTYFYPRWSPSGRKLLVVETKLEQEFRTLVLSRSGGAPIDTIPGAYYQWTRSGDQYFTFPTKGNRLAFIDASDSMAIVTRGATRQQILARFHVEVFTDSLDWWFDVAERPRSNQFAFPMTSDTYDSSRIWIAAIDSAHRHGAGQQDTTRTQRRLVSDTGTILSLEWSPGGEYLYYLISDTRLGSSYLDPRSSKIRRIKVAGNGLSAGAPETVATGLAEWSTTDAQGTDDGDLYVVRVGSTKSILVGRVDDRSWELRVFSPLPGVATRPRFSPEGRRLAFVSNGNLHVVDVESGAETRFTDVDSVVASVDLSWSPDGSALAFGLRKAGTVSVATLRSGTVTVFARSAIGAAGNLAWGPDGRILYQPLNSPNLMLLDEKTGEISPLIPPDSAVLGMGLRSPQFSPDARRVAFTWARNRSRDRGIYVLDLKDRRIRKVLPGFWRVLGWSADGRSLYGVGDDLRRVMEIPLNGGAALRERAYLNGMDVEDGAVGSGWVALEVSRNQGDVWRIEQLTARRKR